MEWSISSSDAVRDTSGTVCRSCQGCHFESFPLGRSMHAVTCASGSAEIHVGCLRLLSLRGSMNSSGKRVEGESPDQGMENPRCLALPYGESVPFSTRERQSYGGIMVFPGRFMSLTSYYGHDEGQGHGHGTCVCLHWLHLFIVVQSSSCLFKALHTCSYRFSPC